MELQQKQLHPLLQELTIDESRNINGGESLWYWIAYGASATAHGIVDLFENACTTSIRPSEYR